MMLQILVYAYLRNIYSSRRIEEFCRNDIRFMWLTGTRVPDHNTINRFRSSRLKDVLKTVFATIVKFLVAEGFVSLDVACTDGTKMEANANRYTFVWASPSTPASPESRNSLRRYGGTPSPSPSRSCATPLPSLTRTSPPRRWKGRWSRYMRLWKERMRTGK